MTPEQFQDLADLFPDAALLLDGEVVLALNRAAENVFGPRDRVIGTPLAELVKTSPHALTQYLHACACSGDPVAGSLSVSAEDNTPVLLRCEGKVLPPHSEAERSLVLLRLVPRESELDDLLVLNRRIEELNREVVRRKEAEAELRRQQELVRVTLASIGDAVIATDTEGRVTFLNPVAETMTGWGSDAHGRRLSEVFPVINEHSRQPVEHPVAKVIRHGSVVELANHTVLLARDGTERPIEDSAAPIRAEDGSIIGVVMVFHDVAERRRSEVAIARAYEDLEVRVRARTAELMESEERFRLLVDQVKDYAIFMLDTTGHVATWNTGAAFIKGYQADEIIGKHLSVFYTQEAVDRKWPDYELEVAKKVGRFEDEGWRVRKDGTQFWANVVITALFGESGELRGFAKVTRDLTERRERELGLERRVQERTAALEEAGRRKDEFLAMLAHELRNPMAPIATGLTILQMAPDSTRNNLKILEMLDRQVQHMTRLVDDLLDVSRVSRGKINLLHERVDLAKLVRTTAEDRRRAAESADLTLDVKIPGGPAWVMGDTIRLAQIVGNLIDNAIKFTEPGGRIDVELVTNAADGTAEVRVHDTGVGIDPEVLPTLFEPFRQADQTLHRAKGGLGLGLALVKGLTEMHHGSVQATSDGVGLGSEFIVSLPLTGATGHAGEQAEEKDSSNRSRILIIEDNIDAAVSLQIILDMMGHEVLMAHTGPEGVQVAAEWQPDVIICDIGLPGMNGFEAARAIRRQPAGAVMQLVAVTGYGTEEDRRRAKESGFDALLTKPTTITDLVPFLRRRNT